MSNIISQLDFVHQVGIEIANSVSIFTPQLVRLLTGPNQLAQLLSSSILITVSNRFFLVTTAHSFNEEDVDRIGIKIENHFYKLQGLSVNCDPNESDNHDPNKIDIAVIELQNDAVAFLSRKYQFLPWAKILFAHTSSEKLKYLILGYPKIQTQSFYPTKTVTATPVAIAANGVDEDCYMCENVNVNRTIILNIDQKRFGQTPNKYITSLPELEGISGCGVWVVSDLLNQTPEYKLVSIITGQNPDKTLLFSSRIEAVSTILAKKFNVTDI